MEEPSPISLESPVGLVFLAAIFSLLSRLQKFSLGFLTLFYHPRAKLQASPLRRTSNTAEEDFKFKLGREDVGVVMEKMGLHCNQEGEQLKEFSGFDEFSVMFEEEEPSLEEVNMAFSVFDENKDGFIDAEDLQRVLLKLGFTEGRDLDECRRMIHLCVGNNDSQIDFNGFLKFMERSFC
ncbi:putative EF-hand domain-containing protein [Dioscorea sansibarensis]